MDWTDAVTEPLALWIVLAAAVGLLVPDLAQLRGLVLPVLAVMIGAMGLTLSPDRFAAVEPASAGRLLLLSGLVAVPAWIVARLIGAGPAVTLGFVVLGAVTPELTTPVMVHLADGDVALATTVLVGAGVASLLTVPGWMVLLVGRSIAFDPLAILRPLVVAVVAPVALAVAARARWPERVARGDDLYPAVSALMVVIVVMLVTAVNADLVLAAPERLAVVAVGAALLLGEGLALGWLGSRGLTVPERRTALLSTGMRDFAVAAGLVLAAGLPAVAALPAVVFGPLEMVAAAAIARGLATGPEPF